jgi:tetratricopeptide (TPR) repeat protein
MRHAGSFVTLTSLILGSVLPLEMALAQGRSSGPASKTTLPPAAPSLTQPGETGDTVNRGWYLSGKVLMDDGSAPPVNVSIQRACGAGNRPVAYTDSKGRFSFQVGHDVEILPDASVDIGDRSSTGLGSPIGGSTRQGQSSGALGTRQLTGCELLAVLPGYRSDVVQLGLRNYMDNPDVGSIVLHRLGNVEGTSISATSLEAPHDAKKAYDKGLDAAKKQKWPDAQAEFEKAVGVYPKYAAAWFELGNALQHQGNKPQARDAFQKSLEADRRFLKPYLPLSVMAFDEKNWEQTLDLTATLTRLDPVDYPLAYLFNAMANASLGKFDAAEKSAREAIKVDTGHQVPRAEYVLGLILLDKHDYDGALTLLRNYIQRAPNAPDSERIKTQITQIESQARAQPQPAAPQH